MIFWAEGWNNPDLRPYGFIRALVARMVWVHFTSWYSTLFCTFALEFVPMIISGVGTRNSGSRHFDSGLFVAWFWHSWFSYCSLHIHFVHVVIFGSFLISTGLCAFALSGRTGKITIRHITTSALLHMQVLVLSAPSRAFGNCLDFYGVWTWRFAFLLFLYLSFGWLVIVIQLGHFPIFRTDYFVIRHFRFCHNRRRWYSCRN